MPYVDVRPENAQIWYYTNLIDDDLRNLDRAKPTVILIHGAATDSSFFDLQFSDPRFSRAFNMLALDSRSAGKTKNPLDPSRDTWTEAADVAKAVILLGLPPVHVFAAGTIPQRVAIHLAALWPEICLSIAWIGMRVTQEPDWMQSVDADLMTCVVEAEDIEPVEEAAHELIYYLFADRLPEEREDRFAAYLAMEYTGHNSPRVYDFHVIHVGRAPLEPAESAMVKQPVLLIQGTMNPLYGEADLMHVEDQLPNAAVVETYSVEGPDLLYCVPQYAQKVNDLFVDFVSRVPPPSPRARTPSLQEAMASALHAQASLLGLDTAGDPLLSRSFSRVPAEEQAGRALLYAQVADAAKARSTAGILGPDRQPVRKYSERHNGEWGPRAASLDTGFGAIVVTDSDEMEVE